MSECECECVVSFCVYEQFITFNLLCYVALYCVVGENCVMMLCERLLKFEPLCW